MKTGPFPYHDIKSKFIPCSVSGGSLPLVSQSGWCSSLRDFFSGRLFLFFPSWAAFFSGRLFTELLQTQSMTGKYSRNFVPGISKYNIILCVCAFLSTYFILVFSRNSPFLLLTSFISLNVCPVPLGGFRCHLMPVLDWIGQLASLSFRVFIYKMGIADTYHMGHEEDCRG